jgi:phosphoglycerate dehydrogenase-like enzyme
MSMPPASFIRILISHTLHEGLGDWILARRPALQIRARGAADITPEDVEWAEVFVGFRPPSNVPAWQRAFRWIHCIGAGVDAFAFRTGLGPEVLLTRTSEDFGPQIGEYCLARSLAVTQRLRALDVEQRARVWVPKHPAQLRGTRVLVVGTGTVGRAIARAYSALGCTVDGISRHGSHVQPFHRVASMARFARLMDGARWLILACPLTEATVHLIDRARLRECAGACLINVGRGPLVDETALPEALDHGWLSAAALDVFEREPLPPESPLWERPDVMISPHISGLTTIPGAGEGFLTCLADLEAGRRPSLTVDPAQGY